MNNEEQTIPDLNYARKLFRTLVSSKLSSRKYMEYENHNHPFLTFEDFGEEDTFWPTRSTSVHKDELHAHGFITIKLFTTFNVYYIRASATPDRSYMCCEMMSRIPSMGESHCRRGDLTDGPISYETWIKILNDIIACEANEALNRERS